jgi:perosamine synthetase
MEKEKPVKVPISRTELSEKEFEIIKRPLESGWIVQGPYVKKFEEKFSDFTGAKHSIAVTSCTSALQLSLAALGFSAGDEAIVPAFTWISTANVIEHLGGKVVFCDIDLKTFNIDITQIESKITKRTKAIIPVHLFGLPVNMSPILELAKKYNLWVVEDAACGFGSTYKNQHVGTFGDTGCFSFHPRKAITTGEGGMITTNNDLLASKLRSLRDHGAQISDFQRHHGAKPYLLSEFPFAGYNYRMTDIQASIGLTQLSRGSQIIQERRKIAKKYNDVFNDFNFFQIPLDGEIYSNSYQSYPCIFNYKETNLKNLKTINFARNKFMDYLQKLGISTRPATHAVHMLSYYKKKYKLKPEDFINAYIADQSSISFPLFNGLKKIEQEYVIEKVQKNFVK